MRVASQGKLVREVEPEADSDVPVTNQLMPGAGVCPENLARVPRSVRAQMCLSAVESVRV